MLKTNLRTSVVLAAALLILSVTARAQYLMENLGRGVVAIRQNATDVYVGWRLLGTDSSTVVFNLYRSTGDGPAIQLNAAPISDSTNFIDTSADLTQSNAYFVRPVVNGIERAPSEAFTLPASAPVQQYLNVPLQIPAGGTTPDGVSYTYTASDASVGDLDGDGEYEIILKWDPTNSKDNSQSGYTGNVYLDAYKLNGTRLWRIDLGRNIRAGSHYTQFQVYDLDGDGKAEVACKTAPGTVDGAGQNVILAGDDPNADYRNSSGYILSGPEYLTVFNGQTGAAMATVSYNPLRGNVSDWGDSYGNRVDRFLAGVAYLDGRRPSLIMARGYYTRAYVAAWDWRDGKLTNRWNFDTGHEGTSNPYAAWRGQGSHSLTIGDVDGDGRDEITYGAAAIDDDGSGLYSTQLGHGDALHMSDMDPDRPGQEVWMVHESPSQYGSNGEEFRDAKTGQLIFGVPGEGTDVGRGVAFDIDPNHRGYEMWGPRGGLMSAKGYQISVAKPSSMNFAVWWDADLLREIEDGTSIRKWDWTTSTQNVILAPSGIASNNSTKATPSLLGDILGDWREEVIWRTDDNTALRIYTTTIPAQNRIYTLMHDRQYREAVAWQNTAYNQPPHPSFYLGDGMATPPQPNIVTSLADLPAVAPAVTSINRFDPFSERTGAASVTFRVTFNAPVAGVDASDFALTTAGGVNGTVSGVTAVSGFAYNVTVGSLAGTGTIRLDLKGSGTGISSSGVPISGGFTGGETYFRATLWWINPVTGGLWSDPANWDGGVVADGLNNVPTFGSFDLTANNTVILDTPRTVSGITFGDANNASAASWTIDPGGNPDNALTLAVTTGVPTVTVNALGTNATATIAAPVGSANGLVKAGPGTLVLNAPNSYGGATSVTGGTLRLAPAGQLTTTTMSLSAATTQLNVAGGSLTASGLVTLNASGSSATSANLIVDSGTANFNGGLTNSNNDGVSMRVGGGTLNTASVTLQRGSYTTSPSYSTGFIVTGGAANVSGTVRLGTNNSSSSMSVEGGTVNVGGTITIGNQTSGGRGGALRVTNGVFNSTDVVNGIVMSRTNGTNANNVSFATFSGGVSTVEKFTLGFDSTVNAGSATIALSGGSLYLGSGGIVKKGTSGLTTAINLSGGTLGAKANWSSALPMTLGGAVNLQAADAAGLPFNVTLSGALSGTGSLMKTGAGTLTLTLSGANTYTGATTVNAGTLRVDGQIAAGGAFNVNGGGTLSGSGSVNRTVTLGSGGTVAPAGTSSAGTLSGSSLNWNGGGELAFDLDAASDRLALSGALTKGSAGTYEFAFNPSAGVTAGTTYTLVTFGSTNFGVTDFTYSGLPSDVKGKFTLEANALKFIVSDNVAPVISALADITLEATSPSGAVATYTATAEDNLDGALPVTFSIPSGSTFALGTTEVTATATDSAGNTTSATFTVTVRDTTAPSVNCPADIVVAAAPGASTAAVNFNVTASDTVSAVTITSSPASGSAFGVGVTSVNVTARDAAGNTSDCSFTVTVRSAPVIVVAPASVQYSDAVTLQANVSAAAFPGQTLAGSVQFFINGSPVGQSALTNGFATLAVIANMPAGSYNVTAQFTSANASYLDAASAAAPLTVTRENAATNYTGDAALLTAGPNVNAATVRLGAHLVPEADGAGFAGDLTKATVTFELFKSNNTSTTPDLVVSDVAVDANGDALATVQGVAAETYNIVVRVDAANQFWTANPVGIGVLNIAVPTDEQRSGGGGWVADASSANGRANFGFTVTSGNKSGSVRGNWTVSFLGADGFYYVAKANSWQDGYLQFAAEPGTSPAVYTRSELKGRCNVQKVDPATGLVVESFGNYSFEAFTSDGDLLTPKQADAYAFVVRDGAGAVWHQAGSRSSLLTLGGGNITNKAR